VVILTTCLIRNTSSVCFLSAGTAAELGIRPLWGKSITAGLADTLFSRIHSPPLQFSLITPIAAQGIQAILFRFDIRVEHPAAALAVNLSDSKVGTFAGNLLLILFFQVILIVIFPITVKAHIVIDL